MSGFAADWLNLREPADARARAPGIVAAVAARLATRAEPVTFIDLGAGTGANLRYTAPLVEAEQRWILVDDDAALLDAAQARIAEALGEDPGTEPVEDGSGRRGIASERPPVPVRVERRRLDLATALDELELPRGCVVTCSALLDLVSDAWLAALVDRCRDADALALFALSYDGRMSITPGHAEDEPCRAAFNAHQRGDKGFGPALGPGAPDAAVTRLETAGFETATEVSDWALGPVDARLQAALVDGWLAAVLELGGTASQLHRARAWHGAHAAGIAAGETRIVVGHRDIAAWPRA
jgi:SAM-dependent methyltransferase